MNPSALHKIGYGLYIVSSVKGDRFNGQIANTVFQITSEPPTLAVSINRQNLTHEYISESGVFSASVLCEAAPLNYIGNWGFKSGRDTDKFEGVEYKVGTTGAPVVTEHAVAYYEAKVTGKLDVGTHTIFIGEVVEAEILTDEVCMTYAHYHDVKRGATPKTAPSYIKEETKKETEITMDKYECTVCGYVYDPAEGDPENGIDPGTPFDKLPDDWTCPVCGAAKSDFKKV